MTTETKEAPKKAVKKVAKVVKKRVPKKPAKKPAAKKEEPKKEETKFKISEKVKDRVSQTVEFLKKNPESTLAEIQAATENKNVGISWLKKHDCVLPQKMEAKRGLVYSLTSNADKVMQEIA